MDLTSLFPLMCHWELKLNTFTFYFYCNCWIVYFLSCKGYVCITSITRLYVCAWSKLKSQEQGVCPLKYTFFYTQQVEGGGGYSMFVVHSHLKQDTENYPKKTGFFKEQNVGFSAHIHRVSLTKTWFKRKACHIPLKSTKPFWTLLLFTI